MSSKKLVASNTFYQLIAKVITASTTLLITVLISRFLGAQKFGEFSVIMAYTLTFYILADFGVNAVVVKDFSTNKEHAKEHFSEVLSFKVIMGVVITSISLLVLAIMPYPTFIKTAILLSLPLVLMQSIVKAPQVIFQSFLKYQYHMLASGVGNVLTLIFVGVIVMSSEPTLEKIMVSYVLGNLVGLFMALYYVRSYINLNARWLNCKYWKYVFWDAFPLGISLVFNSLMIQIDRLLLSVLSTPLSVGFYSLAYRVFDVILVLPSFFMMALYPVLVKYKQQSALKYKKTVKKAILLMTVTAIAITVPIILFSPIAIKLVWGESMSPASVPLNILTSGAVLFFITSPLSWLVLLEDKQKSLIPIYGGAFLINFMLNLVLIPPFDYMGASVVTIFTEMIVLFGLLYILRDYLPTSRLNIRNHAKP